MISFQHHIHPLQGNKGRHRALATDYFVPGVVGIELVSRSVAHNLPHVQFRRVDATRRRSEHVPESALLRVQYLTLWLVSFLVHPAISKLILVSIERSTPHFIR